MAMYEKDQDTVKLNSLNPTSKRHDGVWSQRRQEPLSIQAGRAALDELRQSKSLSPGTLCKADEIKLKRREAAKWVSSLTNETVAFTTDREFRAALRSGVLLCKIMNEVAPGTIQIVHTGDDVNNTKQRYENVQNFMAAAKTMGVPNDYMLSMADLECDSQEDRPSVADCILWLKRLHGSSVPPSPSPFPDIAQPIPESPRRNFVKTFSTSGISHAPTLPRGAEQISTLQGLSSMLRDKMSYKAGTATSRTSGVYEANSTVSNLGPVLENVLNNLTTEYERRLLNKDQEIQSAKERLAMAQKEVEVLQGCVGRLNKELEAARQQATVDALAAATEQVQKYEAQIAELEARLEAREGEVEELRRLLSMQDGAVDEVRRQAAAELQEARDKLAQVEQVTQTYKTVMEENKRLYNQVQDLRGAIRVFCRIRPAGKTGDSTEVCIDVGSEQELAICDPNPRAHPHQQHMKGYRFDRVFGETTTQEEIYSDTQPLIRSVLDGYNVCIFAYGQTGSGKTHTMSGTDTHHYAGRGINYRALDDLFALRDQRASEVQYDINVQMLEIYNESLRDLLVDNADSASNRLEIWNTQPSGCNVPGAVKITVRDTEDVLDMMARGSRNRHSAETLMNQRSSRSHQVLTVIVDGQNMVTGQRTHGCLHLIDLAGSERTDKSGAKDQRMVEAQNINSSLTSLGSVMAALARKDKHIPFRDSKLTQLLADSLSGQAKVMIFVHISPEGSSYQESTGTLEFANRVAQITLGKPKRNVESGEVFKSHEEIHRLRSQLEQQESEIHRLSERLRLAEERAAHAEDRAAEDQQQRRAVETPFTERTSYQSAGSVTAESRLPINMTLAYLSPASSIPQRTGGPPPVSPYNAAHTPIMTTIREDTPPDALATPTSAMPMHPATPNSARSSSVFSAPSSLPRSNLKSSMSMRENGRWGAPVGGGYLGTPTNHTSSAGVPPQDRPLMASAATAQPKISTGARARPPAAPVRQSAQLPSTGSLSKRPDGDPRLSQDLTRSVSGGLPRSASLNTPSSRVGSARPSTAVPSSARTSGVYGRGTMAAGLHTVPATEKAAAAQVPASAGGRTTRWGGTMKPVTVSRWN